MEEVRRGLVQYEDSRDEAAARGRAAPKNNVADAMNVALGVGGGIAAYKAAELARALMERGLRVDVVMTRGGRAIHHAADLCRAHRPQGYHRPVRFRRERRGNAFERHRAHSPWRRTTTVGDRARYRRSDGELAHGLADDFLTTTYLAFTGPVVLAPAMNTQHVGASGDAGKSGDRLRERGHVIVEPGEGLLACGMIGPGRLAETESTSPISMRGTLRSGLANSHAIWKARRC